MESARATRADLFDPASLAALGRIEIVARWIVEGFIAGLHRSPRKGFSVEFAYAERLVAAIALLFLLQRDAVGLVRLDDEIRTAIPPRARGGQWQRLIA